MIYLNIKREITILVIGIIIIALPFVLNGQSNSIYKKPLFEENLNWEQLKFKAKIENKYIFVECFATWCAPCKKMDTLVYTNDSVVELLNEQFISVKVQMDQPKLDNEKIKKRYPDADFIHHKYKITSYPTFLFFCTKWFISFQICWV